MSRSATVSPRGSPRPEYPSPTPCQSLRHSVAAELFTIQSFSPACPIGHALDISFENWTSSLRIYSKKKCRFPNRVSSSSSLTCGDASCLTRCHRAFVSNSCHFSGPIRNHPDGPAKVVGRRAGAYAQFRHVTAGTKQSPGRITPTAVDGNFWSAQWEEPIVSMNHSAALDI